MKSGRFKFERPGRTAARTSTLTTTPATIFSLSVQHPIHSTSVIRTPSPESPVKYDSVGMRAGPPLRQCICRTIYFGIVQSQLLILEFCEVSCTHMD